MTNASDSAQPQIESEYGSDYDHGIEKPFTHTYSYGGLTKREYFAGLAMQAIADAFNPHSEQQKLATRSVELADALIYELNK